MSAREDIVKEIVVDYFSKVLKESLGKDDQIDYRGISYKLYSSYEKALSDISNEKIDGLFWHPV